jgi:hypothetical protein
VLIALLLPAVQVAREAARRMQCNDHLKNITLAMHNYHDVHKSLPYGGIGTIHGAWALRIFPFIEQTALESQYDFNSPYNTTIAGVGFTQSNNALLRGLRISVYTCPSDTRQKASYPTNSTSGVPYEFHNYLVCVGSTGIYNPNDGSSNSGGGLGMGWIPAYPGTGSASTDVHTYGAAFSLIGRDSANPPKPGLNWQAQLTDCRPCGTGNGILT